MPPEPIPWDRKDCFKERKHERSSESLGSVARFRDSSHHGSREYNRWGSADFRRPPGHGKQGGWHLYSEESGHGYVPSRSGDKMLEDDSCRLSVRGDGKYGRSSRENRLGQRDWKGHSWETSNGSPNTSGRLLDVSNNDLRSVDDMITCPSHPNSDFVNTWDQLHLKDQHDKMGGVGGLGTGQRCDRENSLGSSDWKPLKWSRSGSLSSRGSGFSHSSSSKSMGGVDSNETKGDIQLKNATPVQSPSGDAAACVTSAAPSEETTSKKKARLNWGEGLAKYEKKKVEGPEVGVSKDGAIITTCNAEFTHSFISSMAEKSPRVAGFSDCASPATPSSVACSSSPGVEEKSFGKAANIDNDINNLCVSPSSGSQNHLEGFPFNLEKLDMNLIANLGSQLIELLQSDDSSSVDSSFVRSTAINKLSICKSEVSKALEVTESEIDSLENELKLLKSQSESGDPCPAASSSLAVENNTKPCKEDAVSNLTLRPTPLQVVSSGDAAVENTPLCNGALEEVHAAIKDEDIDSPGTATSKFVEPPLTLVNAVSSSGKVEHGDSAGDFDAIQIQSQNMNLKCSVPGSGGEKTGNPVSIDVSLHTGGEDILCNVILTTNRECADRASEVFSKLLPRDQHMTNISRAANLWSCQNASLIKEKFGMRKQFLRFKERVLTLKFKIFRHLWKEDMRLLSVRKHRPKSQKKFDLSLRATLGVNQKHRSSIRSRFSSPAGNLSLVPTAEMLNFTSKLLSDSQVKLYSNTLKMPSLILDKKEKMVSRFISSNGLVEDPWAVEKERVVINPWTPEEKEIFMDKLATFGKDFWKIASFLDHKTTADCVEFYYKNHKSDCFEKTKKQGCSKQAKSFFTSTYLVTSGKKWNREMNAASLDMLGAASMMAARADDRARSRQSSAGRVFLGGYNDSKTLWVDDGILERSSSLDILGNERETVAADVLAGICGSLSSEAMSSCITTSVDPGESYREWKCQKVDSLKGPLTPDVTQNVDDETCSDESCGEMDPSDWTDEEKSIFIQAVSSYGKDFVMISRCVRTRSRDQCKVFFSKARKCLGLDLMHPGPRNVGTPVSDDANGGGSDTEDACVVETGETGSVICGNNSGCKLDEDLPLSTMNMNHDESDPAKIVNLHSDLSKSEENNGIGHMDHELEAVETLASDACQSEKRPELVFHADSNIGDAVKNQSDSVHAQKCAVVLANTEPGGDEVIEQGISIPGSVAVVEGINLVPLSSEVLLENKAVASEGFENELAGQELLLPESSLNDRRDEKSDGDTIGPSSLQCSNQDSNTTGNASHAAAESSCSGFSLNPEYQHKVSLELDSMEKPHVISLPQQSSPSATSVSQDSATILCDKTLNQDRLSSTLDFHGNRDKLSPKSVSRDDFLSGNPLLNHVESSQILRGYPLQMSNKKDMKGDVNCTKLSEVQTLPESDRNISTRYVPQDCYLQKCSSSKPHCSVAELPLLPQKIGQTSVHLRAHSRSLSDTDKPCRNGDVKLFGQILSNPSSMQMPNSSTHESEEKGINNPKLSSRSNLKFSGHHNMDGNSNLLKFDRNNYLGLENVAMTSFGFWDGNRIQTGFSSFPDSAILLAKYPAAFGSYPTPPPKIEPPPLQAVGKSNERNLNGVSVFPSREISSSNGVVDYQVYRSREGSKVQPFAVDMKQRQDIFSEMQRRNGFEAVQPQGRGMVGMNVVGRGGVLVGGPCTGVSDPVAAIKMHYAKTDQYGGQTGSITREEESWIGKGDIGR